jgi:putative nucleotidyltransferase with HDIG domain
MAVRPAIVRQIEQINKELWLVFSLFLVAVTLNFLVESQRMILGFYAFPTLVSAYLYGRRHATLTALASILLVVLMALLDPTLLGGSGQLAAGRWLDTTIWGGTLIVTAYLMGTLYEHQRAQVQELRSTYNGLLLILRHFISKDKYTENHSYRVSVYAARIATELDIGAERIEDVRASALLHDIGKLEISRELLYKAARLTESEFREVKQHTEQGVQLLEPVGGTLRRVLPIILAHHDKFDGSGYHSNRGAEIPLEARIIAVADVYDSLTSDRPYRRAMPSLEVRDIIVKGAGSDFDPQVVDAFVAVFRRGEMELPAVQV